MSPMLRRVPSLCLQVPGATAAHPILRSVATTAPAGPMTTFHGSVARPTLATWPCQAWASAARERMEPAYQALAHISSGSAVAR
eukprot:6680825-Heterocapsa_arctica.AAC.1